MLSDQDHPQANEASREVVGAPGSTEGAVPPPSPVPPAPPVPPVAPAPPAPPAHGAPVQFPQTQNAAGQYSPAQYSPAQYPPAHSTQFPPRQYQQGQYPPGQYPPAGYPPHQGASGQYAGYVATTPGGGAPTPPSKRKLTTGAWVGIGVGALALLAAIVVGIVFLVSLGSDDTSDSKHITPQTEEPPSPSPEKDKGRDDADDEDPKIDSEISGQGFLGLDDQGDFTVGPYWIVNFDDEWRVEVFDVAGENFFAHPDSGCEFYSYQGYGGVASASDHDQTASEITLESAINSGMGIPWNPQNRPMITFDRVVEVPGYGADFGRGYSSVEMLQYIVEYEDDNAQWRTRQMVIRNFQPSDATLFAMTDCPAAKAGVGDAFLTENLFVNDVF